MRITIDMRKLRDSGVGTIISNLTPLVIERLGHLHFSLIGKPNELQGYPWASGPKVTVIECQSKPYSLREQYDIPRLVPKDTNLFWEPFINIPLLYLGKLLVTLCDVNFLALPQNFNLPQRLYARLMYTAMRYKSDHIVSISQFSKNEFMRYVPGNRDNITVTSLGTPAHWHQVVPKHNPNSRPYFLFVGNIKPHKNLRRLTEAFKQIANQVPHDLVLVGKKEGFIVGDQDVLTQEDLAEGRIRFTGYVDKDVLGQYFAHATALVFPSLYEGFGLPPLEAMACGCPTLVSNGSSLPEVCGDASLYCDPYSVDDIAHKMLRIASEPDLRADLITRGKHHAASLTWDACAEKTVAVIKNLLA